MMKSNNPGLGLNLRVTGHCNQGGRKYMEDAFVVAYQQNEEQTDLEYAYFGIFDGHGGGEAALFAKEHLMDNIVSQKGFWSNDDEQVLQAIKNGFLTTHHAMWREVGNWPKTMSGLPSTSGTTCSIAFIRKRKLYTGHVGDSKIVLGFQLPGSTEWCACALTKDHKPESPEERLRIHRNGGLVLNKAGVERVVWNRPKPGHRGPIRRSTPIDQIPFLAVARSLGDLWSYNSLRDEFIVSPEPDVKVININPHMHRCVLFASDGLWNMLSPSQAVGIVQAAEEENEQLIIEGNRANGAAPNNPSKLLVDAALQLWFNLRMRADNTSVVTVLLDPNGPPRKQVVLRQKAMKRLRPRDEQMDEAAEELEVNGACTGKEKRIADENSESQTVKEKRKLPYTIPKPLIKLRKPSSEEDDNVPRNLPRPVIMNPRRVSKRDPAPAPNEESEVDKSSEKQKLPLFVSVKLKKGHDPPNSGTIKEPNWSPKPDHILSPQDHQRIFKRGEASKSVIARTENNKNTPNIFVHKAEVDEVAKKLAEKGLNDSSLKQNGRVHLCEVDNFLKLNERTTGKSTDTKTSTISAKHKSVPRSVKNLRKCTLSYKRKTLRSSKRNFKRCRTGLIRRNCKHNTRAQCGIRKMKV